MKRLMIGMVLVGLFGAGCGSDDSDACSSDSDCKGDRICESGECISPESGGNNTSTNNTSGNNTSQNNTSGNNTSQNNTSTNNTAQNNTSTNNTSGNNTTDEGALGSECTSSSDCDSAYCRTEAGAFSGTCAENDFGDTCQGPEDCEYGACLVSSDGGDVAGYCSSTCESFTDCPTFWSCGELNNASGTYCLQD